MGGIFKKGVLYHGAIVLSAMLGVFHASAKDKGAVHFLRCHGAYIGIAGRVSDQQHLVSCDFRAKGVAFVMSQDWVLLMS